MSDYRHAKACVERAELILEWLVKLQYKPIGAPIVQRDLTDNCAGARQVSCERLVVRVANHKIGADEMSVIVRLKNGGCHTPNETKMSDRHRRRAWLRRKLF